MYFVVSLFHLFGPKGAKRDPTRRPEGVFGKSGFRVGESSIWRLLTGLRGSKNEETPGTGANPTNPYITLSGSLVYLFSPFVFFEKKGKFEKVVFV